MSRRPRSRAEQIVVDHDLPPYAPKVGDILITFHPFNDPVEFQRELAAAAERGISPADYIASERAAGREIAKFRPCIVMAARDNKAILVPLSSRGDPKGRHMAMSEPEELAAAGLAPHKPAYAKVLEAAQYDFPHPLVMPIADEAGAATWVAGSATTEMRRQTALEMSRQKKHGRLEVKIRAADRTPPELVAEAQRLGIEAREQRIAREARQARYNRPAPEAPVDADFERRRKALLVHQRAEALARKRGEHPEQVAPVAALAEDLARRRGTHPDQAQDASSRRADATRD